MNRDEVLREIQRRIAEAKGWTGVRDVDRLRGESIRPLVGTLHADKGPTLIPRWPWDWSDAGALIEEIKSAPEFVGYRIYTPHKLSTAFELLVTPSPYVRYGWGEDEPEAIARCWCDLKGVDLSDLP